MQTELVTQRLKLTRFARADVEALTVALDDPRIAHMTARIPHPYTPADAFAFLALIERGWAIGREYAYAIRFEDKLAGSAGIVVHGSEAELGYWIAAPFWGRGIATEAAQAVCAETFQTLDVARLTAGHFADNPASGRVLRKLGFSPTGETGQRFSIGRGDDAPFVGYALERRPKTGDRFSGKTGEADKSAGRAAA